MSEQTPSKAAHIQIDLDNEMVSFQADRPFGEVADQIKKNLGVDRVVTEVFVDDRFIDLEEEARLQSTPIAEMGQLRFKSREVGALIKESLDLAPQICEALSLECQDIDGLFEKQALGEAHERVGELSALVDWLLQLISGLQSYGKSDFRAMSLGTETPVQSVQRMEQILSQLHTSLMAKNFDQFRSTLQGRFAPEIKVWKQMFESAKSEWAPRSNKIRMN